MPAPETVLPGLPNATAELLLTGLGVTFTLVLAPIVGWAVRRALDTAGLRGPTLEHPGLDWGRVVGAVTTIAVLAVGLPAWLDATTAPEVRRLVQLVLSGVRPLAIPAFVLAASDHYRRVLGERASKVTREARPALEQQAAQLRTGGFVVAGLALVGDGLWSAWPLVLGALVLWAMHDPTLRPTFDRVVADLRAGHALRRRTGFTEGASVVLDGDACVLAGPVGLVNARVRGSAGETVVRNVALLGASGEGPPEIVPTQLAAEAASAEG